MSCEHVDLYCSPGVPDPSVSSCHALMLCSAVACASAHVWLVSVENWSVAALDSRAVSACALAVDAVHVRHVAHLQVVRHAQLVLLLEPVGLVVRRLHREDDVRNRRPLERLGREEHVADKGEGGSPEEDEGDERERRACHQKRPRVHHVRAKDLLILHGAPALTGSAARGLARTALEPALILILHPR